MKRNFTTLFDKNYLPYALALYESLETHVSSYKIYCFCMDDESYEFMLNANRKNIVPISYNQLETHFPELLVAKKNRSMVEYYFTTTSAVCSYIFDNFPDLELLTYLDADLYFFSSPEPIFEELVNASVGIIPHKFNFFGKFFYEKYGKYNVGWISFKNDVSARKCLEDWRKNCLYWCYDRLENGQYADQKYLDYWPENYSGIHSIRAVGANIAPWNVGRYNISLDFKTQVPKVNDQSLIFYHFASLKQLSENEYTTNTCLYMTHLSSEIKDVIYLPFIANVRKYNSELNVKVNVKNRADIIYIGLLKKIKNVYLGVSRVIFEDYIKVKSLK